MALCLEPAHQICIKFAESRCCSFFSEEAEACRSSWSRQANSQLGVFAFSPLNDATNLIVQQDLFLFDIRSVSTSLPETFCVCFVRSQGLNFLRGCVTLLGIRWI